MILPDLPSPGLPDAIAAGVLAIFALEGVIRGLAAVLARFVFLALALAAALVFHRQASLFLMAHTRMQDGTARSLSFGTIFLAVVLGLLVARLLIRTVATMKLEIKGNRIGGLLAGTAGAGCLVFAAFFVLLLWPGDALHKRLGQESLIGASLLRWAPDLHTGFSPDAPAVLDEPPPEKEPSRESHDHIQARTGGDPLPQ
jgi:hypothetical protein